MYINSKKERLQKLPAAIVGLFGRMVEKEEGEVWNKEFILMEKTLFVDLNPPDTRQPEGCDLTDTFLGISPGYLVVMASMCGAL